MENTPFSSHLWMSRYGLLHRNGSHFLGARPLRILQPDASIPTQLPTPSWLNASAYNPSLAAEANLRIAQVRDHLMHAVDCRDGQQQRKAVHRARHVA